MLPPLGENIVLRPSVLAPLFRPNTRKMVFHGTLTNMQSQSIWLLLRGLQVMSMFFPPVGLVGVGGVGLGFGGEGVGVGPC